MYCHFAANGEAAGMRISTSKPKAMVLDRTSPGWWRHPASKGGVQVSRGPCSRVRERWRVRLTKGSVQPLHLWGGCTEPFIVKKELSRNANLLIYWSVYAPTVTYGHELCVVTEMTRSRIEPEMSFLCGVAGRSLRGRVRSLVTQEELRVDLLLLCVERSQPRWLRSLFGCLPSDVFQVCPIRPLR